MYNFIVMILFIIVLIINIGIIALIINLITRYIYKIIKNKIKEDIINGDITDYNKLLLNMNNKINNIEKEIKEMEEKYERNNK